MLVTSPPHSFSVVSGGDSAAASSMSFMSASGMLKKLFMLRYSIILLYSYHFVENGERDALEMLRRDLMEELERKLRQRIGKRGFVMG